MRLHMQCVIYEKSLKLNDIEGANSSARDSNGMRDVIK